MALTRHRLLLLGIAAIELTHTAVAIVQHRVPAGHDGFQYFTLQYYFLNNAVHSHEVAQWIPYMNHGTVATLWYVIQGSFLQNVLLSAAPLLRHADLVVVYHLNALVDEMILVAGISLLARRFFGTAAAAFVTISVMGSTVWLDQPYWNFRVYYALPLVLEVGHRFLETGRWRWFFLAANLLALQAIGNLPYMVPFATFVVFAYFAGFTATHAGTVRERVRTLRWGWAAAAALVFATLSFAVVYKTMTIGIESLLSFNDARNPDGTTTLAGFLTYGGFTDLWKWIDLVLDGSPWMDNTLYAGALAAPLLLVGVVVADRRRLHLSIVTATLLLFSLATPLSSAAYFAWPGMKYFRHIGLVSSVVRVFGCFVAGIGFEWLLDDRGARPPLKRTAGIACALMLVAAAALAIAISRSDAPVDHLGGQVLDRLARAFDANAMAGRLRSSARWDAAAALVVACAAFVTARTRGSAAARRAALVLVVAFVAADVYTFKFRYLIERSDSIPPDARFIARTSPMPYPYRRERDLEDTLDSNRRLAATLAFNGPLRRRFEHRGQEGAQYWTNNAFWFADEVGNSFQADSWLAPLDRLADAVGGRPAVTLRPNAPAAAIISGVDADKIRFFDRAYSIADTALAAILGNPSYRGNLLFLASGPAPGIEPWSAQRALDGNDTVPLNYHVERFDSNTLVVSVFNPASARRWMAYADVWHPSWHATVNGGRVTVHRAEMAYKAVAIEPGANTIRFQFGSRLLAWLATLTAINAAFWLVAAAWMGLSINRSPRASE